MYRWLTILALSAWPFLAFASGNKGNFLDYGTMFAVWAASFASLAVALAVLQRVLQSGKLLTPLVNSTCVGFALFFTYGALNNFLIKNFMVNQARYALIVWAVLVVVVVGSTWRLSQRSESSMVLAAAGGAMALLAAWGAAPDIIESGVASGNQRPEISAPPPKSTVKRQPDVFFFLFDAYGRADMLKAGMGYDNTPFLDQLRQRGFSVLDKSFANFPITNLSLSSTLNMDFVVKPGSGGKRGYLAYQPILAGYNNTVRMFQRVGYSYIHAGSNSWGQSHCRGPGVYCVPAQTEGLSETLSGLLAATPLEITLRKLAPKFIRYKISELPYVTEKIHAIRDRVDGPVFVFAHILIPHETVYRKDCSFRGREGRLVAYIPEKKKVYYTQTLACLNKQIMLYLDWLLAKNPEALVILQSDHGFTLGTDYMFSRPFSEWTKEEVAWRYAILNSIRAPKQCRRHLYPTLSPVNTFRFVRGCLLGKESENLPDNSYFATYYRDKILLRDPAE
jgi:hypothetical protein